MDLDTDAPEISSWFHERIKTRRSVRSFTDHKFSDEVIFNAIKTAASAPSGANRQPWHFSVISNLALKQQIRCAAEAVEKEFYSDARNQSWVKDLNFLNVQIEKSYLEKNSHLIIVSVKTKIEPLDNDYCTKKTYYAKESTSIAIGFLLASLHLAGVSTLTHTPKPIDFLKNLLNLDNHTKPLMIIVTGKADSNFKPLKLDKRPFDEIVSLHI